MLSLLVALAAFLCVSAPVQADEIDDLRTEIEALKQTINRLEARLDREVEAREEISECAVKAEKRAAFSEEQVMHLSERLEGLKEEAYPIVPGLSVGGGITLVGQGTVGADAAIGEDPVDGSLSVDLEVDSRLCEGGEAFLLVEAGAGEGITDELVSFWGVNGDAGDSDSFLELTEAWYEQSLFGDKLVLTAGKVDLSNYFDTNNVANDETAQFLSTGFVNNIAIEFPDNGLGFRAGWAPLEFVNLGVGVQEGDADWEDVYEDPFAIAEVDLHPVKTGHYRFYGWVNATDHAEFHQPQKDRETGWGVGMSMDQQVLDWMTVFGRVGYQDRAVYPFELAWSVGLGASGTAWGRDCDTFGLGWGMAHLSSDYKSSGQAPANARPEGHLEVYYRLFVNEHLEITPNVQFITNALGDGDFGEAAAFAVRAQMSL